MPLLTIILAIASICVFGVGVHLWYKANRQRALSKKRKIEQIPAEIASYELISFDEWIEHQPRYQIVYSFFLGSKQCFHIPEYSITEDHLPEVQSVTKLFYDPRTKVVFDQKEMENNELFAKIFMIFGTIMFCLSFFCMFL